MPRIFLSLTLAGAFVALSPAAASAQSDIGDRDTPASKRGEVSAPATRAVIAFPGAEEGYDARALRTETHWGTMHIVRGADGPVVGKAGVFRTANVEKIVAGSPRAEAEARSFRRNHRKGAVGSAVGAVAFGVGLVASMNSANNATTPIFMIGGLGAMFWGARQLDKSYSSLSRAVWWYNRDLAAQTK